MHTGEQDRLHYFVPGANFGPEGIHLNAFDVKRSLYLTLTPPLPSTPPPPPPIPRSLQYPSLSPGEAVVRDEGMLPLDCAGENIMFCGAVLQSGALLKRFFAVYVGMK